MAPAKKTPQLHHKGMLTLGGILSPGRCVSLLPAQLHIWVSGKAHAPGAMPGDPVP